jgi:hypothetical protein
MASIDELKAAIEKLETSAVDIESNAREMFRSARLINTSKGGLVPYASYEWISPTNDASWKRLQRDVIRKYQEWYSTALQYIKVHSPDRLEEFIRFYGDRTGEFNGVIDALHLNIHYWNGDTTKIVDEHMDWFGRQRDVLLSIPSIVKAQEKVAVTPNPVNSVSNLCERFQFVVRQLRANRKGHEPVDIKDEYDVQYLFHALLQLYFDDIRPEEVTPSYAGGSARMDFLLKPEQIAIETKKWHAVALIPGN